MIIEPLTSLMCSPIADGASAAVLMSPKAARELGVSKPVKILSSVLASGYDYHDGDEKLTTSVSRQAYSYAGVGPEDVNCVELHDASSPAELVYYEALGLCAPGEGVRLLKDGDTRLGGRIPVNTSGGLVRKGHPIGATGLAQIHELTTHATQEAVQASVKCTERAGCIGRKWRRFPWRGFRGNSDFNLGRVSQSPSVLGSR